MTRTLPALIAVLAAFLVPATASAAWLPVKKVGNIAESDQEFRTAANDRGDTILLWGNFQRGFKVAISRRGGPFGQALAVPGSGDASSADVDLNEDGRAIVWWHELVPGKGLRVKLVGLKVDGGFGKPRVVTPASDYLGFNPVIGPGGRFAFVYSTAPRQRPVYARVAPPSGRLGRRITLSSGSIQPAGLWYLGNRPMIAYRQASDDYSRLRERPIGSGSPHVIATVPKNGIVRLATASNGVQVALWTGSDTEGPKRPLVAAVRKPHAPFGQGQTLENRIPPQELAVGVARSGAAVVAWREWNESTTEDDPSPTPEYQPGKILYSFHPAGRAFNTPQAIVADDQRAQVENLSADVESDGVVALAWNETRFQGIQRRLYTAILKHGGLFNLTPMTEFDDLGFRLDRIEIDERERTAFGWIDETQVLARRGNW